jgi:hypothetical protein
MAESGIIRRLCVGERAQMGPIGYVFVFGMVLMGATAVVVVSGPVLTETQEQAELKRAEKAMSQFDSQAALVALGESAGQTVPLGQGSSALGIRPDAGYMAVRHVNHSNSGTSVELFNESLGSMVYEVDRTEIAYQGGGVWRLGPDGEAQMVSAPEFHYQEQTLTLPVIRLDGQARAAGSVRAEIDAQNTGREVFPNESATYPTGRSFENPIKNGSIFVDVKGQYYEAWATYFRQRTSGTVTVFDGNQTTRVELASLGGPPGEFGIPPAGDTVALDGVGEGHPHDDFEINLSVTKNKPHYSLYAVEGNTEIELHTFVDGNPTNACPGTQPSEKVHLSAYYYDGNGTNEYESWEMNSSVDPSTTSAMQWTCDGNDPMLEVDFLSEDIDLTYDEVGKSGNVDPGIDDPNCGTSTGVTRGNKYAFNDHMEDCNGNGWELRDTATWDQHASEVGWEGGSTTYAEGGSATETLANVTDHYVSLTGTDIELVSKHGPGSSTPIDTDESVGTIDYEASDSAEFITYLHVTDSDIEVKFS